MALALCATAPLMAQPAQGERLALPEIAASAAGEVRAVPDRATIVLGVETRASSAGAASSENASKQQAVLAALRSAGVAAADIATVSYTIMPDMVYDDSTRSTRVAGYVARNMVRVELKDIARVGAVVDAAVGAGANGVNSLNFSSSRAEELRRSALKLAVQKACRDASAMAEAAGGQLGQLMMASSSDNGGGQPVPMQMMRAEAKMTTPIEPGEMTISVLVDTRWRFIGGRQAPPGASPAACR